MLAREHNGFRQIDGRYVDINMAIDMAVDVDIKRQEIMTGPLQSSESVMDTGIYINSGADNCGNCPG